ncbi:MAG: hypothetical protein ACTSRH_05180 [Promethearchaeota archaeon]
MNHNRIKSLLNYLYLWKPKNAYIWSLRKYLNFFSEYTKKNAIKIVNKEWDYLIVLDACRYDMFKYIIRHNCKYIISGGSVTQEWLRWNFKGHFNDIVYIAGNPHFSIINLKKTFGWNPFYKVVEVWDYGWDKTLKTVHPREVTIASLIANKIYPNKKLIIHYNQPHHPFISNKKYLKFDEGTWNSLYKSLGESKYTIWDALKSRKIQMKEFWKAYIENLKIVMKYVSILLKELNGKIVITSDHGNLVGEYMLFGHFSHLRSKYLVKVPWLEIENKRSNLKMNLIRLFYDNKINEEILIAMNIIKLKNQKLNI